MGHEVEDMPWSALPGYVAWQDPHGLDWTLANIGERWAFVRGTQHEYFLPLQTNNAPSEVQRVQKLVDFEDLIHSGDMNVMFTCINNVYFYFVYFRVLFRLIFVSVPIFYRTKNGQTPLGTLFG